MNRRIKIQGYHERVWNAINASGMTACEIAEKCGRKRNTFYVDSQMNSGTLAKFCSVTGVSADYILGLKREMK